MKVLVTGGCGYIGAHLIKQLVEDGNFEISVVDKNPQQNPIEKYCQHIYDVDLARPDDSFFTSSSFMRVDEYDAIVHLAAYISVEESTKQPTRYYKNNIDSTLNLLRKEFGDYGHFLFASTGAAFDPTNPYATSKIVCEDLIKEQAAGKFTNFRFFNVSGLDNEFHPTGTPTHLIRRAAMAAAGKIDKLTIFGDDFDTRDGTCIRDYVHVKDLAGTIVRLIKNGPVCTPYECIGSGTGFTVKEIIHGMEAATGVTLNTVIGPRRDGDAPVTLTPSVSKFMEVNHSILDMCRSAYENERKS